MDREKIITAMREAISNVLETMFFQPIQFADDNYALKEWFSQEGPLIGATLGFEGPSGGLFYLIIPRVLASEWTANFLGLEDDEINEEQKRDTVKEALNMIGGGALSIFDRKGEYSLKIPKLIEERELSQDRLEALNGKNILIETENNRTAAGIIPAQG